ncbi:hypothetical protein [Rhizobium sp. AG855]|uniref:hypothetical protein n=1 Tax=Rhizobium sp. AG855 TaxID=2183898 RepID=UPI0011C44CEB|nr:hypothetical protein [Rhizobium sp. AG855]
MRKLIVLALCAGVSGCVSSPKGNVTPISMDQLIEKVRCELKESSRTSKYLTNGGSVAATLTLQTTNVGAFGSTLTPADALSKPGETFSFALPFGFERSTKRSYTQLFTIDLATALTEGCVSHSNSPVIGDIGVDALVKEYATTYEYLQQRRKNGGGRGIQVATITDDKQALFSGTTEFTAKLSAGPAGPTWVLSHLTAALNLTGSSEAFGQLQLAFVDVTFEKPKRQEINLRQRKKADQIQTPSVSQESIINRAPAGFNLLLYNNNLLNNDQR